MALFNRQLQVLRAGDAGLGPVRPGDGAGAKVKMRGVQVGRVSGDHRRGTASQLASWNIYPDQIQYIPANVGAQIRATTAFGAKYVDLVYPARPQPRSG